MLIVQNVSSIITPIEYSTLSDCLCLCVCGTRYLKNGSIKLLGPVRHWALSILHVGQGHEVTLKIILFSIYTRQMIKSYISALAKCRSCY